VSTQYTKPFVLDHAVAATPQVFELGYPARGTLKHWAIKKLSGDMTTARVSLYASEVAANADDITQRLLDKTSTVPWIEYVDRDFINREGTPSNQVRKLWLRIAPSDGIGAQQFHVELGCHLPTLY
jgi:hypothetical protein